MAMARFQKVKSSTMHYWKVETNLH